ncbi:hypothetical protein OBO34_07225 [Clostridiales Family XIII bacterium ASD5510]|uniref:Uncharacterized protein n=1 Tax=Hominibacterium faecale TaxID=2839743 RepID=A0A9J6QKX3_9FIRM|nr:hypothetical protein [Hominibacterium faecale]MCU7378144.1 hypothetical protein [Hominibacterium faecale]
MIKLTDKEKEIVKKLDDSLFTAEYLEEWINRKDRVDVNAPAALQAVGAQGYYRAVRRIAEYGFFGEMEALLKHIEKLGTRYLEGEISDE